MTTRPSWIRSPWIVPASVLRRPRQRWSAAEQLAAFASGLALIVAGLALLPPGTWTQAIVIVGALSVVDIAFRVRRHRRERR